MIWRLLMAGVMIGIDPHKGSHTAVAIGPGEEPLGELRVRACPSQAEQLLAWAAAWPGRAWAVEGAAGLGHLLAQQLVAAGGQVLDVPPKLAARVRLLQAGDTNKNDPHDALPVAVAALRSPARRPVLAEDHAAVLKMWAKRHRDLARLRNQAACRLHAVLCDLVPGGHAKEISAGQAARILEQVTPSGAVAAARCELAAEFLTDIRHLDAQLRDTGKKLAAAVNASGTSLTGIFGVGPVIAGTVIGDVRQVFRFPGRDHFAAYNSRRPGRGVLRRPQGLPAAAARQPAAQPRDPHGRDHPDPPQAQPGPRLLRQETRRRQNAQGGAAGAQAPDQRRDLRRAGGRHPQGRCHLPPGPGRATGEPLDLQGGRLTPRTPALRASHSRACHHPTARRDGRSRPRSAEPGPSAPDRPHRGRFEENPANHLTPTAKRTRYARPTGSVML
jgi:transposase